MKKTEVIEGLKSLIDDRESFLSEDGDNNIFLEDIEVLREAIKIILGCNVVDFKLSEIGCPFCHESNNFSFISSDENYKNYQCRSCNSRIKVRVIER